jgi:glutathione-regulated potassium-efflux system ancillary protein KefG
MPRKILLLFAHPAWRRSRINRALVEAARGMDGVTLHDLYETYPDFAIDVDREQEQLAAHDAVVCQHPFYWYSSPAIIKEWLDLVLEHGWAYGREGTQLRGKTWMQAITTGGREIAYAADGHNRYTIDELMRPFEATTQLCGMRWERPFVVHAAHTADQTEIDAAAAAYRTRLTALRDGSPLRIAG